MKAASKRYRILIVDNQRSVRSMLRSALDSLSLDRDPEIQEATSGEEAQLALSQHPVVIDLLVTGLRLAGISGVELARRLRSNSPELRLILLTSTDDEKSHQQALEAKTDALIPKPVAIPEFNAAVLRCLGQPNAPVSAEDLRAVRPETLRKRLEGVRQEMDALAVLVINQGYEVLAQAGSTPSVEISAFLPAIQDALDASARLARTMGIDVPDDLMCFSGPKLDLFVAHLGGEHALLVAFDSGAIEITRARAARLVSDTVRDLAASLPIIGETGSLNNEVAEVPVEDPPVNEEENTAEIEAIFSQTPENDLDTGELDEFWEAAADEHADPESSDPDAVSFDQAQEMGIVDEDAEKD